MKITKDYSGLKDIGWAYGLQGDLISEETIEIELDKYLYVTGNIKSKFSIIAKDGCGIKAGGGIEAGLGIEAGWGIEAGLSIICTQEIKCPLRIFAGLCTWQIPSEEETYIIAQKIIGQVCYGIPVIIE